MSESMSKLKELIHIMRQHSTVTFTLHGLGESIFECSYFDKVVEELGQLEAKAKELDRREKGVAVITREYSSGEVYDFCGNCELAVCDDEVYCLTCGFKLIRESEVKR
jgi:hypothetical protein